MPTTLGTRLGTMLGTYIDWTGSDTWPVPPPLPGEPFYVIQEGEPVISGPGNRVTV